MSGSGTGESGPLHVAVIGAGVGGLGAALALSRIGHRVTLLERDTAPTQASVEEAFDAERRGAPQVRHSHGLAARLHHVLATRFPDVLDALLASGVGVYDLGAQLPPDLAAELGDAQVLAARRTTYEWVLRRAVSASPSVEVRAGVAADGLVVSGGSAAAADVRPPRVTGVRLSDAPAVSADAVVASTGRRGDLVGWLAQHSIALPECIEPTGITYFSRFYRLQPGRSLAAGILQATSRKAGVNYMCVAADNGTYSITLAIDSADGELRRHVLEPSRYEAVCRLLPGIDTLVDADFAAPISAVNAMGGLINRHRRFADTAGRPIVAGLHAIGDAHTTTNPLYGRGCALAMVQAALLADAFAAYPADAIARAAAYETASAQEIEPWYHFAIDGDALRSLDDTVDPEDPRFTLRDVMRVGAAEPSLLPKTLRTVTLLDTPDVLADDDLFRSALTTLRAEHARKLAARQAQGYQPPLTRAGLLHAGTSAG